jgi:hypothetical protein
VRKKTVVRAFTDRDAAERALAQLTAVGFSREDISLVMSEEACAREFGPASAEGASRGGAWGSLLGAFAGAFAAMSVAALPGIGLVAVGPVVAAAAGAGAGGAAGTLLGTLVSSGVSESEAHAAQEAVSHGHILLAVHAELGQVAEAEAILRGEGGVTISSIEIETPRD